MGPNVPTLSTVLPNSGGACRPWGGSRLLPLSAHCEHGKSQPQHNKFLSEPMGQTALLERLGAKLLWEGEGRVGLCPKMGTSGRRARELGGFQSIIRQGQAAALGLGLCPIVSRWDLRKAIP